MKSIPPNFAWFNLPNLPMPVKVLFSGYLLAIGLGLCMAGLQIMQTHGMADGKPGPSLDDILVLLILASMRRSKRSPKSMKAQVFKP